MARKALLWGLSLSLSGIIIFTAVGLLYALASGSEFFYLSSYVGFVSIASLLAGSLVAGYLNYQRGWLSGGLVGFIISVFVLVFSMLVLPRGINPWEATMAVLPGTILAAMAGVCGANVARAKRKKQKGNLKRIKFKTQRY